MRLFVDAQIIHKITKNFFVVLVKPAQRQPALKAPGMPLIERLTEILAEILAETLVETLVETLNWFLLHAACGFPPAWGGL